MNHFEPPCLLRESIMHALGSLLTLNARATAAATHSNPPHTTNFSPSVVLKWTKAIRAKQAYEVL
jgi:hypothetical protein